MSELLREKKNIRADIKGENLKIGQFLRLAISIERVHFISQHSKIGVSDIRINDMLIECAFTVKYLYSEEFSQFCYFVDIPFRVPWHGRWYM